MSKSQSNQDYIDSDEFFYHSLELENHWKRSLPKLNDKELVEAFCPSKEMLSENISKWKKEYERLKTEIKKDLVGIPEKDQWLYDVLFEKLRIPELLKIENRIFQLKRQLAIVEGPTKKLFTRYENFQEMIAIAKSRSVIELARDKLELKSSGKNFVALCPFHNEKTPSLYFYAETNTFYCFGCHEKGDVIKFYMLLHGVDFKNAIKSLQ
ncbi:MAG: CHC2 zinc finger domain-containing protein [Parcubacteria group bacterium]